MTTEALFRERPYETELEATVTAAGDGWIALDRTLFYPRGGGQPGDVGTLAAATGELIVSDTVAGEDGEIHHCITGADAPPVGTRVTGRVDWTVRYPRMRMHTCMHLLSVAIPAPVTGGNLSESRGRLDFDLPDATLERDTVTAQLNELIAADHPVTTEWITRDELAARPELVKTLSVQPPTDAEWVRLVRIGDIDVQPCGGTHVAATAEIGRVRVARIEKKSRHNRRVAVVFDER